MTMTNELHAFVASWNVNGKYCSDDLREWLLPPPGAQRPDIYVLGFQEFDLTKESFIQNDPKRLKSWTDLVENTISLQGKYQQVASSHLVGMLIIMYATPEVASQITELDTSMVGTGYASIMGNKGAVALRFNLGSTSICFVNAHLNAHTYNVKRRQEDYESICQRMVFFSDTPIDVGLSNYPEILNHVETEDDLSTNLSPSPEKSGVLSATAAEDEMVCAPMPSTDGSVRVLDHDIIVWFGDLNYRIELSREEIHRYIKDQNWEALLQGDQLRREMDAGRVFQDFVDPPTTFPPSYKFDSGTDRYDTSPKNRLPAYCDRVLWRIGSHVPDTSIQQLNYACTMSCRSSDHKPVSSLLKITLPAGTKRNVSRRRNAGPKGGYLSTMLTTNLSRNGKRYAIYASAALVVAYVLTVWWRS